MSEDLGNRTTNLVGPVVLHGAPVDRARELRRILSSRRLRVDRRVERRLIRLVVHDQSWILGCVDTLEEVDQAIEVALVLGTNSLEPSIFLKGTINLGQVKLVSAPSL